MAKKPTTTIRIDLSVKEKANAVFDEIGITLSTAVNSFLKKVVAEGRIPFDINLKNQNLKMPSKNATLNMAFINKKDEFYTLYEDIEKEIEFYKDKLKNKVVLCNCDDPFESSFFKYFVNNFERLQLKTLISTCYKKSSFSGSEYPLEGSKDAYKAIVKRVPSHSLNMPDGSLDLASLFEIKENSLERLDNDGDFRDEECLHLLEQSDVVVTNPPFSLFREYISCLISKKKKFKVVKYGGYPEEIRADAISMSKCSRWFKRGYYQGLAERAKDIKNIKKIMKRYKNDLVEMIKCGIVGEYDE